MKNIKLFMVATAVLSCYWLPGVAQQTVCAGSTITLKNAASGGVWSSSNNAIATVNQTGVVSGVAAGEATILYTVDNNNSATTAITVAVKPLPNAGTITGSTTICPGTTGALADNVPGGVWSSSDNTVAMVSADGIVTGIAPGSVNISYSVSNGCGADDAVATIAIPASPDAGTIIGATTVCAGSSVALLSNGAADGMWTSNNTLVAAVNSSGMVTGIAQGAATISYTVKTDCGVASAAAVITVNPLPNTGLIHGATATSEAGTISLSDAMSGGQWSSSDNTIAVVSPGGIVTGIAAGSVNISYSVANSCGADDAIVSIKIEPGPQGSPSNASVYGAAGASPADVPVGDEWYYSSQSAATLRSRPQQK